MPTLSRPLQTDHNPVHYGQAPGFPRLKQPLVAFWIGTASLFAAAIFALASNRNALLFLSGGVFMLAVSFMQKRSARSLPLPVIPVFILLATATTGYLYYPIIENDALVSFRINHDAQDYREALIAFASCAALIALGAATSLRTRRHGSQAAHKMVNESIVKTYGNRLLLCTAAPLMLFFYAYGYQGIIERNHHLEYAASQSAVSLSSIALPVGACLVILVLTNSQTTRPQKLVATLLLLAYTTAYLSSGSRGLAFVPASLLLITLATRTLKPLSATILIACTLPLIIWGISVPLEVRVAADGAGIMPTLRLIADDPSILTSPNVGRMLGNILFGIPLAGQIIGQGELPSFGFWTSISPLPSGLTRWAELQPLVSWAPWTPYNAIGELVVYGIPHLVCYMYTVGFLLGYIDNWISKRPHITRQVLFIVAAGATMLFSLGLLQYPLRNSSRYLWYLTVALLAFRLTQLAFRKNMYTASKSNAYNSFTTSKGLL